MSKALRRHMLVVVALTASTLGAIAQGTAPVAQRPTAVGTTEQSANGANKKAVQRSDTATLVRTEKSAPNKEAASTPAPTDTLAAPTPLAPKPDRN